MEQTAAVDLLERGGPDTDNVVLGNLQINLANYRATVAGALVDLTFQEFEFLRRLADNPDRIVPFETLARDLWDQTGHREIRRLNVIAFRLRAKLAALQPYRIETVRGRGYGLLLDKNHAPVSDD
jgi:DNA-binding response OmpR family regulator